MSLQKLKVVRGLRKLEASCMTSSRSLNHMVSVFLTHKMEAVKKYTTSLKVTLKLLYTKTNFQKAEIIL